MSVYRQTMTITIEVEADNRKEAEELAADIYYDYPHFWEPDKVVIISSEED